MTLVDIFRSPFAACALGEDVADESFADIDGHFFI
jgi:hypothetical protein